LKEVYHIWIRMESRETPPGLALRVAVSILVFFGGLIIAIIYAAFFAPSFSTFKKMLPFWL
jgi:hypothetical protein